MFKVRLITNDFNLLDNYTAKNTSPNILLCGSSMKEPLPAGLDKDCATSFGVIVLPIHGGKNVSAQILINYQGSIFTRVYRTVPSTMWTSWNKISI